MIKYNSVYVCTHAVCILLLKQFTSSLTLSRYQQKVSASRLVVHTLFINHFAWKLSRNFISCYGRHELSLSWILFSRSLLLTDESSNLETVFHFSLFLQLKWAFANNKIEPKYLGHIFLRIKAKSISRNKICKLFFISLPWLPFDIHIGWCCATVLHLHRNFLLL